MKCFSGILILIFGMSISIFAQSIKGSMHDFRTLGSNLFKSDEPCLVCHPPHKRKDISGDLPLWSTQAVNDTFVVYSSAAISEKPGDPLGTSKICLSCHDGTLALDSWGGVIKSMKFLSKNFGYQKSGLKNDHPISIKYNTSIAMKDGSLSDPHIVISGLGNTIEMDLLKNGKLQCSSCHDVHNEMGVGKLLIKSNDNSNLCLTCHIK